MIDATVTVRTTRAEVVVSTALSLTTTTRKISRPMPKSANAVAEIGKGIQRDLYDRESKGIGREGLTKEEDYCT